MSVWNKLLETAVHAPSPHNVQPWRIRIISDALDTSSITSPLQADLLIEKHRTLPKEDPTGSFIILTMGLFIEALSILAASRSLDLAYELHQAPSQFTPQHIAKATEELLPFAKLTLKQMTTPHELAPHDDALFLIRRTSRISLLPTPIADEDARALAALARQWGQRYEQVTSPDLIENVL